MRPGNNGAYVQKHPSRTVLSLRWCLFCDLLQKKIKKIYSLEFTCLKDSLHPFC
jgi:hypothetical protein